MCSGRLSLSLNILFCARRKFFIKEIYLGFFLSEMCVLDGHLWLILVLHFVLHLSLVICSLHQTIMNKCVVVIIIWIVSSPFLERIKIKIKKICLVSTLQLFQFWWVIYIQNIWSACEFYWNIVWTIRRPLCLIFQRISVLCTVIKKESDI